MLAAVVIIPGTQEQSMQLFIEKAVFIDSHLILKIHVTSAFSSMQLNDFLSYSSKKDMLHLSHLS